MPTPTPITPAQRTFAVTACVVLAHGAGLAALVATASRPPATEPAPIQVTLIDLPAPAKPAPPAKTPPTSNGAGALPEGCAPADGSAAKTQTFTAAPHHLLQAVLQSGCALQLSMLDGHQPRQPQGRKRLIHQTHTLVKRLGATPGVKHQVFQGTPFSIVRHRLSHRARDAVKLATPHPQLTIQRQRWQCGQKPRGRRDHPPAAKAQDLPIPHGAHAIELFTDQIAPG